MCKIDIGGSRRIMCYPGKTKTHQSPTRKNFYKNIIISICLHRCIFQSQQENFFSHLILFLSNLHKWPSSENAIRLKLVKVQMHVLFYQGYESIYKRMSMWTRYCWAVLIHRKLSVCTLLVRVDHHPPKGSQEILIWHEIRRERILYLNILNLYNLFK